MNKYILLSGLLLLLSCKSTQQSTVRSSIDSLAVTRLSDMAIYADSIVFSAVIGDGGTGGRGDSQTDRRLDSQTVRHSDSETFRQLGSEAVGHVISGIIYRPTLTKKDTVLVTETRTDTLVTLRTTEHPARQPPVLTWVNIGVGILLVVFLLLKYRQCSRLSA